MSDSKPCPFCGGCDISREYGAMVEPYMICMDCGCSIGGNANTWNRRADLPPTTAHIMADPRVKALVEALEVIACRRVIHNPFWWQADARAALAQLKEPKP